MARDRGTLGTACSPPPLQRPGISSTSPFTQFYTFFLLFTFGSPFQLLLLEAELARPQASLRKLQAEGEAPPGPRGTREQGWSDGGGGHTSYVEAREECCRHCFRQNLMSCLVT